VTTPVSAGAATPAAPAADTPELKQLKAVAHQFEAVFMRQMIGSMRQASLGDGIFDSDATGQFRDMADAKTAESMANKGVLGVADLLVKQFGARVAGTAAAAVAPKVAK
jgi:peptidoglycan hydrolase FlgJ